MFLSVYDILDLERSDECIIDFKIIKDVFLFYFCVCHHPLKHQNKGASFFCMQGFK